MTEVTTRDDGWGVSDDYDIAEFYPKATDGRGHSDNLRVRVKPDLAGEVAALVATGNIPEYTTSQDFIRDAMVHRLRWLAEHADDPALSARLADAVRRTVIEETTSRYITLIDSFEEFLERAHSVCDRALRWNDHEGLAGFLADVREYAENTRDPYSSRLREVIKHYESQLKIEHLVDVPLDGGAGPDDEGTEG